ncbi:MAG: CBS domain-containing protein [Thermodesulfobacteriota bacterium]|nr:CBS domain-containing protein [Thermodesulfobacteriota bacterium]
MKIIVTHKGTDFDALASLVAAKILYPEAVAVLPKTINPNLKGFLSIHKDIFDFYHPSEVDLDEVTTMIVVDTNSWNRLEGMEKLKNKKDLEIIVIDHHVKGDIQADISVREETGSNVTLMIRELSRQKKIITPIQASLFLMGLYEDTGNLTFPSTLAEDARAAGYLLERKADLHILATFLRHAYGKKQKDILFEMIQSAERSEVSGFTISVSCLDIEGHVQNLSLVVQMYRDIVNVDAAFGVFRDTERDKCMVIGRSRVEDINVGLIMRSLGGGGHPGAGSALVKSGTPEVLEEMIIELIKGNQHSSVIIGDIMSFPVVTVDEDSLVEEAALMLRELGCTGMPVVDKNEKIVGVLSRRDFRKVKKMSEMQSPVKAFMSRDIVTIDREKSAIDAARLMIKHDIGRIPVIEKDKIVGIVTRSDVMLYFYDLLPD